MQEHTHQEKLRIPTRLTHSQLRRKGTITTTAMPNILMSLNQIGWYLQFQKNHHQILGYFQPFSLY